MARARSPLFPLFTDLQGRAVLVVGGGAVAERKLEALLEAGARPRVQAPSVTSRVQAWIDGGDVEWIGHTFEDAALNEVWFVIAATDDTRLNRSVADAAERRQRWANVVDDAELSSIHMPARVQRGDLQIAISSGGGAPMIARHLRRRIESWLDESWATITDLFGRERERIRARFPDLSERRRFFEQMLDGPLPRLLRQQRFEQATLCLHDALDAPTPSEPHSGSVVLVGAGPGDPGLLTLNALRAMNEADVILHDRLVSAEVLQLGRRDAQRIEVGKSANGHSVTQEQIHALMLEHARAGRRVVRLKGGDPFVFGRGGEELEFLRAHGIAYEVVPGITAAIACAAYAGIPLTHRRYAQSVRLVTAHCQASLDMLDWAALARERQTLAFYMGVAGLEHIQQRMLTEGCPATTPFALIERGSRNDQRVIAGRLDGLAASARAHGVASPALLILGEVAARAVDLQWFGAPVLTSTFPFDSPAQPELSHAA